MANLQDAEKAFAPLFGMTVGEAHRIGRALQKGGNIRTGKPGGNVNARGVSITLRETATLLIALAAPGPAVAISDTASKIAGLIGKGFDGKRVNFISALCDVMIDLLGNCCVPYTAALHWHGDVIWASIEDDKRALVFSPVGGGREFLEHFWVEHEVQDSWPHAVRTTTLNTMLLRLAAQTYGPKLSQSIGEQLYERGELKRLLTEPTHQI